MKQFSTLICLALLCSPVLAADKAGEKSKDNKSPAKTETPTKAGKTAAKKEGGSVDIKQGLDIIGSQDAPLELNIVPWKDKENSLPKNPLEASVLNETLDPIDRDVVRREVDFSRALQQLPAATP